MTFSLQSAVIWRSISAMGDACWRPGALSFPVNPRNTWQVIKRGLGEILRAISIYLSVRTNALSLSKHCISKLHAPRGVVEYIISIEDRWSWRMVIGHQIIVCHEPLNSTQSCHNMLVLSSEFSLHQKVYRHCGKLRMLRSLWSRSINVTRQFRRRPKINILR